MDVGPHDRSKYVFPWSAGADEWIASADLIIDIRSEEAFQQGHLPGAIHAAPYAVKYVKLIQGRKVLLVDEGLGSAATEELGDALMEQGAVSMHVVWGGLVGWISSGREIAGSIRKQGHFPQLTWRNLLEIKSLEHWMLVGLDEEGKDVCHADRFPVHRFATWEEAFQAVNQREDQTAWPLQVVMVTNHPEALGAYAGPPREGVLFYVLEEGWQDAEQAGSILAAAERGGEKRMIPMAGEASPGVRSPCGCR